MKCIISLFTILVLLLSFTAIPSFAEEHTNYLMNHYLSARPVLNGVGNKIGEYAYMVFAPELLDMVTEDDLEQFCTEVVDANGGNYNWLIVDFMDGTCLFFSGCSSAMMSYAYVAKDNMCGNSIVDYWKMTKAEFLEKVIDARKSLNLGSY